MFPVAVGLSALAINHIANKDITIYEKEDPMYTQIRDGPIPLRMWVLHDSKYPNTSGQLEQVDRGTSFVKLQELFADRSHVNDLRNQGEYWNVASKNRVFWKYELESEFLPTFTDASGWRQEALPEYTSPLDNPRRVPYNIGFGENPNKW